MSSLQLTKTKMREGVWQGIITGMDEEDPPSIQVTHENTVLQDIVLTHNESADHWTLSVPIPMQAIADGVQTLIIRDADTNTKLGHIKWTCCARSWTCSRARFVSIAWRRDKPRHDYMLIILVVVDASLFPLMQQPDQGT
jgi:hypothetical protein